MNPFKPKALAPVPTTDLVGLFVATWSGRCRAKQGGKPLFVLNDTPLNDADLGSESGVLPLVMWHAENVYRYGIKESGFGASFRQDADALLQRTVGLQKVHRSTAELLCFTLEALEDIRAHLPRSMKSPTATELRSLVAQFAHEMGVVPGVAPVSGQSFGARPHG
ncbi:hypothetical protein [Methylibium petroleiphilum]|uniref:Uncharacterized protein n=1 Tax=Methylibium petroleiphilum (strain ATCC BAA-1232 / LMG 22953 / PM1) TaxID=420662 RepID=A2SMQ2_METPP|nr:hypothetical protein [Methylibium petroleiphilum]ABM96841.1 hypothetical protein Mpe_B0062 [Methylibium petroleiphilum PM1]